MKNIIEWKKFLNDKGVYKLSFKNIDNDNADEDFIHALYKLEYKISKFIPSVKGLICKGEADLDDVKEAYDLFEKHKECFSQATLDALGDPAEEGHFDGPLFQAFITRDDSNIDEWNPSTEQTQGRLVNQVPNNSIKMTEDLIKNIKNLKNK